MSVTTSMGVYFLKRIFGKNEPTILNMYSYKHHNKSESTKIREFPNKQESASGTV